MSAGEVTSHITLLPCVLTLASSQGSGATCELLAERTDYLGCVVFRAWETGPRRGRPGPAGLRHLVPATRGQESTQPGPGATPSPAFIPVGRPDPRAPPLWHCQAEPRAHGRHRCSAVRPGRPGCLPHMSRPLLYPRQSEAYAAAPSHLLICRHQRHFNK